MPTPDFTATENLPILFSRDQIQTRVAEMGRQIREDLHGEPAVLIGVLKGAAIFLADLARSISADCTFDFVSASSYKSGTQTSGAVQLIKDLDEPIEDKNIVVIEDILDTGVTLSFLYSHFERHKPRSIRIAALLDKPSRRIQPIRADYVGFEIPNEFVVGYGMDYAERYRNLPDIRILTPEVIS
jgi:hypoxanthine phosphoribosyltransferase